MSGMGAAANAAKKVGRNDPCPCGSGKKFKQCCEARNAAPGSGVAGKSTPVAATRERVKALEPRCADALGGRTVGQRNCAVQGNRAALLERS